VVCIAPIGGELVGYAELIRTLDVPGPVLGLRPAAGAKDVALTTVEAIAADHVERLLAAHAGPYVLVGWSFGGVVAFEMARLLSQESARRCEVIAVDSYPGFMEALPEPAQLLVEYVHDLCAVRGVAPPPLPADAGVEAVWAETVRARLLTAPEVSILRQSFEKYAASRAAWSRYRGAKATLRMHWLRASATGAGRIGRVEGAREWWSSCATRGVLETTVDADHYSIMRGPGVAAIADRIASSLAAVRARAGRDRDDGSD
jgi:thioesterase domain-containing protein